VRTIGLNLLVAVALFLAAYANSPRQRVVDVYQAYMRAVATQDVRTLCALTEQDETIDRCAREAYEADRIPSAEQAQNWASMLAGARVDVSFSSDDSATATLSAGGCAMRYFDMYFDRDDDGTWVMAGPNPTRGSEPPCTERGEIPPPQFAWTYQGRNWR
jgi:hypothetical protein